jgi:hypothetical protein
MDKNWVQVHHLIIQQTLLQRGFDYTRENKYEQLFSERGKFKYTGSAKPAAIAYEKYHCCKTESKAVPLHAMEAHGGRGGIAPTHFNLGTRWGWVVSVTPRPRFTPGTHWIGGWVGPRAGLDAGARRNILCPWRGSNLDRPIVQPVRSQTLYCLSYRGSIPIPLLFKMLSTVQYDIVWCLTLCWYFILISTVPLIFYYKL